jgi:hypothetical protein
MTVGRGYSGSGSSKTWRPDSVFFVIFVDTEKMVWQTRARTPLKNYFVHSDLNEMTPRKKISPCAH